VIQFGSERAEPLDPPYVLDGLAWVQSTQRRRIQHAVERCLGDCSQILTRCDNTDHAAAS
jgi:hypothetical protein